MSLAYPLPVARLIEELSRLPGIGPRSAQRLAFHLLQSDANDVRRLADALVAAREGVRHCSVCQNLSDADPCRICASPNRERSQILVVEEAKDVIAVERTGQYRGQYHVLGGAIAPVDGVGPEQLKIRELLARLKDGEVTEIILATGPDVEGEATALYLSRLLQQPSLKVTRIARGLPVGGDLDFVDEVTLVRAIEGRQAF